MTLTLSQELAATQIEIEQHAREYGLDFPEIRYIMLDYAQMNETAAYDGFPTRYPHWRFGMEYDRLSKSYAYGLQRIYEMVINNDPVYAYLLVSNSFVDQKLVMAHVCGHADFFQNNLWFAHTNRRMLDEMANHGTHIRRHIERFGYDAVENFLDICLSLDNLIDVNAPGIQRRPTPRRPDEEEERPTVRRLQAKSYMDEYINPPDFIEQQKRKIEAEQEKRKRFPEEPEHDILLFLLEHAPLENWQHDILSIVREEAYYFAPQRQTKIMNEGWASYWHSTIMTQKALRPSELIDYADHHSGTMATSPGRLNPYKIGIELFRDIEERWNRGQFGPEWEACDDVQAKENWDKKLGLGRQKLFEVRKIYNDIGFIDAFLTEDFARRHKLFTYRYDKQTRQYRIDSRDFADIKRALLFQLTNFGQPVITVEDANYNNRGELYLLHHHEGVDLHTGYAVDTLANLAAVWRRPVHIETIVEGEGRVLFSHDGREPDKTRLDK